MKDYSDLIALLRKEEGTDGSDYDSAMEEAADAIEDLSEQLKPRMLEGTDYEVKQALWVGNREVIMAERPKYGDGDRGHQSGILCRHQPALALHRWLRRQRFPAWPYLLLYQSSRYRQAGELLPQRHHGHHGPCTLARLGKGWSEEYSAGREGDRQAVPVLPDPDS